MYRRKETISWPPMARQAKRTWCLAAKVKPVSAPAESSQALILLSASLNSIEMIAGAKPKLAYSTLEATMSHEWYAPSVLPRCK
jgi:hypothetical protein